MKMKNHITGILALCLAFMAGSLNAQERVYVSTDKNSYLAGEDVWFTVFCEDNSNERTMSSIAYLEFHSAEGLASTVKVGEAEGSGFRSALQQVTIPLFHILQRMAAIQKVSLQERW